MELVLYISRGIFRDVFIRDWNIFLEKLLILGWVDILIGKNFLIILMNKISEGIYRSMIIISK